MVFEILALIAIAAAAPLKTEFHQQLRFRNLKAFSFTDCAPSSAPVHANLSISPDPVVIPGNVSGSASLGVVGNLSSPIKAEVTLEKKEGIWIKVPCVKNVGSCTYDDICTLLEKVPLQPDGSCPKPLPSLGIPCRCPIPSFRVALPPTTAYANVSLPGIADGDYKASLSLTGSDGSQIGCAQLEFSLAKP
eukprot:TRINITY_DN12531_c7_g3_i2.p1 TRINITY_DN12531_c7_g3~~TRINITY_DN12531_c7_g3_i2.p1  ORF type:complete len:208 (+),score=19.72 TRINITY_DN12531_c7_g3_i2:53-625(+)